MKEANFAPFYSCYLLAFVEVAREHGYAMAVHGTMTRDMDLVCIPWTDGATSAEDLIQALHKRSHSEFPLGEMSMMKHYRKAWTISLGGKNFFDISIMPRKPQRSGLVRSMEIKGCTINKEPTK